MQLYSGVAAVYHDPDILPAPIKKYLPIKEPEGKSMTLEEYEKWRASQSKYPDASAVVGKKEEK